MTTSQKSQQVHNLAAQYAAPAGGYASTEEDKHGQSPWDTALDYYVLRRRNGAFRSCRLLIAFGGPQIWIDTEYNWAYVAWWGHPQLRRCPMAWPNGSIIFCLSSSRSRPERRPATATRRRSAGSVTPQTI